MVEVEVLVKNVEANRLSDQVSDETAVTFDVNASIAETEHETGQFTVKFSIAITAQPPIARMDVAGTAPSFKCAARKLTAPFWLLSPSAAISS